jgi:3-mercaptopyruvate sulfurtransferase SseA
MPSDEEMNVTTRSQHLAQANSQHTSSSDTDIRQIDAHVMKEILEGRLNSIYDNTYIIDCRSPHEYHGGHIRGAINQWTAKGMNKLLFRRTLSQRKSLIVLHCEHSEIRAPRMQVPSSQ